MARRQVSPPRSDRATSPLTLQEAADKLAVHYMTAYRYVRTGRLRASKRDGVWMVEAAELERMRAGSGARAAPAGRGRVSHARRVPELAERLVAGDEAGAWTLAQAALTGGASPADLYLEIFVPALRLIGERWSSGEITVADEHCATVVMQRLVGRMGPLFRRRGRTRGIVVLGAPEGELHALPTALAADLLRGNGFVVVDLGANVPVPSFVDCVQRLPRVIAVGIAVTTASHRAAAGRLVAALRDGGVTVPVILGGAGVTEREARRLGADRWAGDALRLVSLLAERP